MDAMLLPLLAKIDAQYAALLVWALTSTALNVKLVLALGAAQDRFSAFVRELARFNRRFEERHLPPAPDDASG